MNKYYKVVRVNKIGNQSTLWSYYFDGLTDSMRIMYEPNKWIDANRSLLEQGFGLCVFSTLNRALDFCNPKKNNKFEIWECEVKPVNYHALKHHGLQA